MPRVTSITSRNLVGIGITFSSPAWNLSAAIYTSKSSLVSAQDGWPAGLSFKKDGTAMFIVGKDNNTVYQYTLSTPWDVSTASYSSRSLSVSAQVNQPNSIDFRIDGARMYVTGWGNTSIFQYTLSIPWDLSTATYSGVSFNYSATSVSNSGLRFSTTGDNFYITGNNDTIFQFKVSTPWDVSTASYANKSKFVGTSGNLNPTGIDFKFDGTIMFVQDTSSANSRRITAWVMSTPWDLSTATESTNKFSVGTQDTNPYDFYMRYDGLGFYIVGPNQDTVFQYSMQPFSQPAYSFSSLFPQPAIGTAYASGYYAGRFTIDGGATTYKLIVSPKANEQSLQIKTTFTDTGTNTTTIDGFARSNEMNTSEFPAASYCRGLTVGGYTDWYLPSRDELEILYRNLKPGVNSNNINTRQTDSLGHGTNTNSIPAGSAYTTSNPGQTPVDLFKAGGAQVLAASTYWSSSRAVTQPAYCWNQSIDGAQSWGTHPTTSYNVRPVRRELEPTTFSVFPSSASVNEGSAITWNMTTTGIPTGTTLYYTLTPSTETSSSGGSFTVAANGFNQTVDNVTADLTTEGPETLTFQLRTLGFSGPIVATASVIINDTSIALPSVVSYYGATGQSTTVTNSRLTLSTAQKKFGTGSLQGTTVQGFAGRANAVNVPLSAALTGPFTVEGWVYLTVGSDGPDFQASPPLYLHGPNNVDVATVNAVNSVRLYSYGPNISNISYNDQIAQGNVLIGGNNDQNAVPVPLNTWQHMALSVSGNQRAIWINGTRRSLATMTATFTATLNYLTLNAFGAGSGPQYIDEIRVSNIDRYGVTNATITVPTTEFTSDANTLALVKF